VERWMGLDDAPEDWGASVATIGVFDGVHRGHQRILARAAAAAGRLGLPLVVVTFDPHPAEVIRPGSHPNLLCSLRRRAQLLEEHGAAAVLVLAFTEEFSRLSPDEFVRAVLADELHARHVVVGENFRFGHDRRGDVALLVELADEGGYDVEAVSLDATGGSAISATRIRALVAAGDVEAAAALLGRPHELEGTVVRGDGRGRELGFPTANLHVDPQLAVPGVGIYAGAWTFPEGESVPAAISVGRRPTFVANGDVLVEAYLCDFDGDLYGTRGRLGFTARLRDELAFERVEDLVAQMADDVAAVRALQTR
jgi:riboflavin kinase / FMN adenylyltransferase